MKGQMTIPVYHMEHDFTSQKIIKKIPLQSPFYKRNLIQGITKKSKLSIYPVKT